MRSPESTPMQRPSSFFGYWFISVGYLNKYVYATSSIINILELWHYNRQGLHRTGFAFNYQVLIDNLNKFHNRPAMAQQVASQDINMEDVLKLMCTVDGANEYVVTNAEGIPIKKSPNISAQRALQISFLINDYWSTARKIIQNDLRQADNVVEEIRIRTSKQQQIILIQSFHGQATLYLVQNCQTKKLQTEKKQAKVE